MKLLEDLVTEYETIPWCVEPGHSEIKLFGKVLREAKEPVVENIIGRMNIVPNPVRMQLESIDELSETVKLRMAVVDGYELYGLFIGTRDLNNPLLCTVYIDLFKKL